MRSKNLTMKSRMLALSVLTPLVLLTACGSGGATPGVTGNPNALVQKSPSQTSTVASTVPANGDVNPYGVAIVKQTVGNLTAGNILVSNFNNSQNLQGTGTTIMQISPSGSASLFAKIDANTLPGACPGGVGLTTALVELNAGWVIVGSLPTSDGSAATASAGCLIVLDSKGKPVATITDQQINGPWDMTAVEDAGSAKLFVSNVLNGTVAGNGQVVNQGTVVRIDLQLPDNGMPTVSTITPIGTEFSERTDPAALVIGPTGLALSPPSKDGGIMGSDRVLYVADSLNNRIAVITDPINRAATAGTGSTLVDKANGGLNDPLGLAVDPAGNIVTVNGNNGFLLVFDPNGKQIAKRLLDNTATPPGAGGGTLFGLAITAGGGIYFVDDGSNTLNFVNDPAKF
jgi:hypothetical protein